MKNPIGILGRLFTRSETPLVTQLFTHVMGRPLLVHPALGQQLVGAYLAGAVEAGEPLEASMQIASGSASGDGSVVQRQIRVLNISGGLVPRPVPGVCDPGPASYEAIRQRFDAALADDSVAGIVLRVDSPGGLASGLFDLADHVHANRGAKPIVGVVDDMAYSAAFALVAACDEVWVSRTGGVGSVGCAAFHFSQAGYNKNIGLEVTPIYSGAHKIDFNPHFALSDEAKAGAQADVDALRELFVGSVALYRGLSADAVRATEAQCYSGQAGIDVGFATHLGTFGDAMASLESKVSGQAPADDHVDDQADEIDNGGEDVPPAAVPDATADASAPSQEANATAPNATGVASVPNEITAAVALAALVGAARASGLSAELQVALTARSELVGAGEAPEQALAYANSVRDLCVAAGEGMESLAANFVSRNVQLDAVRQQLLAAKAEDGPELQTSPPPGFKGGAVSNGRWAATIVRFGGK